MDEQPLESLIAKIVSGSAEVSSVPLSQAGEAAEALADAGSEEALLQHVERVLPRLLKKERVDEIEAVWLACCAAGVLPVETLVRTADRLVARGRGEVVGELLLMLSEALLEAGRAEDALGVLRQGLALVPSEALLEGAKAALRALHAGAPNLEPVLSDLDRDAAAGQPVGAVARAERALRFHPGLFLEWPDRTLGEVVATDGVEATIRHPSGVTEPRRVDHEPPPKVLTAEAHEVRRLFEPDQLHADWLADPARTLLSLLHYQQGVLSVSALEGILVPKLVTAAELEAILKRLRRECSAGDPELPAYESRRRLFVAPGFTAPPPKRKASRPKRPAAGSSPPPSPLKAAPRPAEPRPSSGTAVAARWVDLTARPEIKALIAHIEAEIGELTHEMNADLPKKLEEARAHGDLRENAEYDAAKERLRLVQSRIEQLHGRLARVHELSHVRLIPGRVTTMSLVTVADEATGEERTYRLVPPELPAPEPGDVSIGTPYAKALLGKEAGDPVVVRLPRRVERLEIVKVVDPAAT